MLPFAASKLLESFIDASRDPRLARRQEMDASITSSSSPDLQETEDEDDGPQDTPWKIVPLTSDSMKGILKRTIVNDRVINQEGQNENKGSSVEPVPEEDTPKKKIRISLSDYMDKKMPKQSSVTESDNTDDSQPAVSSDEQSEHPKWHATSVELEFEQRLNMSVPPPVQRKTTTLATECTQTPSSDKSSPKAIETDFKEMEQFLQSMKKHSKAEEEEIRKIIDESSEYIVAGESEKGADGNKAKQKEERDESEDGKSCQASIKEQGSKVSASTQTAQPVATQTDTQSTQPIDPPMFSAKAPRSTQLLSDQDVSISTQTVPLQSTQANVSVPLPSTQANVSVPALEMQSAQQLASMKSAAEIPRALQSDLEKYTSSQTVPPMSNQATLLKPIPQAQHFAPLNFATEMPKSTVGQFDQGKSVSSDTESSVSSQTHIPGVQSTQHLVPLRFASEISRSTSQQLAQEKEARPLPTAPTIPGVQSTQHFVPLRCATEVPSLITSQTDQEKSVSASSHPGPPVSIPIPAHSTQHLAPLRYATETLKSTPLQSDQEKGVSTPAVPPVPSSIPVHSTQHLAPLRYATETSATIPTDEEKLGSNQAVPSVSVPIPAHSTQHLAPLRYGTEAQKTSKHDQEKVMSTQAMQQISTQPSMPEQIAQPSHHLAPLRFATETQSRTQQDQEKSLTTPVGQQISTEPSMSEPIVQSTQHFVPLSTEIQRTTQHDQMKPLQSHAMQLVSTQPSMPEPTAQSTHHLAPLRFATEIPVSTSLQDEAFPSQAIPFISDEPTTQVQATQHLASLRYATELPRTPQSDQLLSDGNRLGSDGRLPRSPLTSVGNRVQGSDPKHLPKLREPLVIPKSAVKELLSELENSVIKITAEKLKQCRSSKSSHGSDITSHLYQLSPLSTSDIDLSSEINIYPFYSELETFKLPQDHSMRSKSKHLKLHRQYQLEQIPPVPSKQKEFPSPKGSNLPLQNVVSDLCKNLARAISDGVQMAGLGLQSDMDVPISQHLPILSKFGIQPISAKTDPLESIDTSSGRKPQEFDNLITSLCDDIEKKTEMIEKLLSQRKSRIHGSKQSGEILRKYHHSTERAQSFGERIQSENKDPLQRSDREEMSCDKEERYHDRDERRSRDREKRYHDRDERRSRDRDERRSRDREERYHDRDERSRDREERYHDRDERRSRDREERYHDRDERSRDREERYHDRDERSRDREERYHDRDERGSCDREERYHGRDERSRDRGERYRERDGRSRDRKERYDKEETQSRDREEEMGNYDREGRRSYDREERYYDREKRSREREERYYDREERISYDRDKKRSRDREERRSHDRKERRSHSSEDRSKHRTRRRKHSSSKEGRSSHRENSAGDPETESRSHDTAVESGRLSGSNKRSYRNHGSSFERNVAKSKMSEEQTTEERKPDDEAVDISTRLHALASNGNKLSESVSTRSEKAKIISEKEKENVNKSDTTDSHKGSITGAEPVGTSVATDANSKTVEHNASSSNKSSTSAPKSSLDSHSGAGSSGPSGSGDSQLLKSPTTEASSGTTLKPPTTEAPSGTTLKSPTSVSSSGVFGSPFKISFKHNFSLAKSTKDPDSSSSKQQEQPKQADSGKQRTFDILIGKRKDKDKSKSAQGRLFRKIHVGEEGFCGPTKEQLKAISHNQQVTQSEDKAAENISEPQTDNGASASQPQIATESTSSLDTDDQTKKQPGEHDDSAAVSVEEPSTGETLQQGRVEQVKKFTSSILDEGKKRDFAGRISWCFDRRIWPCCFP